MTSGFSDDSGPDSSADGSSCISHLSLSSSLNHHSSSFLFVTTQQLYLFSNLIKLHGGLQFIIISMNVESFLPVGGEPNVKLPWVEGGIF